MQYNKVFLLRKNKSNINSFKEVGNGNLQWMKIQQMHITSDHMPYLKPDGTMIVCVVPKSACWMITDYRVIVVEMRQGVDFHEHIVMGILCNKKEIIIHSLKFLLLYCCSRADVRLNLF